MTINFRKETFMRMKKSVLRTAALALFLMAVMLCSIFAVSAEELRWEITLDAVNDDFSIEASSTLLTGTDEDGSYIYNNDSNPGELAVLDTNNLLGTSATFSVEGEFYFDAFPTGLRGTSTPAESPLSLLCWRVKQGDVNIFNAVRLDDEGYIHTASDGTGKTDVKLDTGKWYKIRLVVMPKNGICELRVDGVKSFVFSIGKFDPQYHTSDAFRFFDSYYNWSAKMRNLVIEGDGGLPREDAADFISFQTTKPQNGSFDVRLIAGINSLEYDRFGYQVLLLNRNTAGEIVVTERKGTDTKAYSAVYGGNTSYNIKENFGYDYACLATIKGLDATSKHTELVVRPYILDLDGTKRYGVTTVLAYRGQTDSDGYPVLSEVNDAQYHTVVASADTYIYQNTSSVNYGTETELVVKNITGETGSYFRAVYYKFTLSADEVAKLQTAAKAVLSLPFKGYANESSSVGRTACDMLLHEVKKKYSWVSEWSETGLTYQNRNYYVTTGDLICSYDHERLVAGSSVEVDILDYLNSQTPSSDGSITVSFRLTSEAHSDAITTYWYSRESEYKPSIIIYENFYNNDLQIEKFANIGYEPWGYAEKLVDEWFEGGEREKLYAAEYEAPELEKVNNDTAYGDFSVYNPMADRTKNAYIRTLSTLSGYKMEEETLYDEYGGITNLGVEGSATGYYHIERIDGKVYIIDPIGNPFFSNGVNALTHGDSANQRDYTIEQYGTEQEFYAAIATDLLGNFGINTAYMSNDTANVELPKNGMNVVVDVYDGAINSYMRTLGLAVSTGGSSTFRHNNTMNVFDPDFIAHADKKISKTVAPYLNQPYLLGYTSDNELPGDADFLKRYLTLSTTEPVNAFSYAAAWTWFRRATDNHNPSLNDVTPELNQEFLAFAYNRYFKIVSEAFDKYDPNHMYIGTRSNGSTGDEEGYLRAAGQYLDLVTVNTYGDQDYVYVDTAIEKVYRYTGLPFIVTEFGMRALESVDMNGYKLGNYGDTACWLFETQQQRANSYESYVINLLESDNCAGWVIYRFRDNDQSIYEDAEGNKYLLCSDRSATEPVYENIETGEQVNASQKVITKVYEGETDTSNLSHNKGIYDNHNQPYSEMRTSIKAISDNLATLVKYFAK